MKESIYITIIIALIIGVTLLFAISSSETEEKSKCKSVLDQVIDELTNCTSKINSITASTPYPPFKTNQTINMTSFKNTHYN
jgi:hypothetical protein